MCPVGTGPESGKGTAKRAAKKKKMKVNAKATAMCSLSSMRKSFVFDVVSTAIAEKDSSTKNAAVAVDMLPNT